MSTSITRRELYERVWTTPMMTLAKELGISRTWIRTVCHRWQIPMPSSMWRLEKQIGHVVSPPPPLRELSASARYFGDVMPFQPRSNIHRPVEHDGEIPPEIAFERDPANAIVVPADLPIVHPLLIQQQEYWRATAENEIESDNPRPHLEIRVTSPQTKARALHLLQALFTALEARGHSVAATIDGKANITLLGETVHLFVRELLRVAPRRGRKSSSRDLVPSGELDVRIEGDGSRTSWLDRPNERLGKRLNRLIERLIRAALEQKHFRTERERWERQCREREHRERERVRRQRQEQQRISSFERAFKQWRKNQDQRLFVDRLRAEIGTVDPESQVGRLLAWAEEYVRRSDALSAFQNDDNATLQTFSPEDDREH